jgi:hypothetical protein
VAEEVRGARSGGGKAEAVACDEAGLHGRAAGWWEKYLGMDGRGDKVERPASKGFGKGEGSVLL